MEERSARGQLCFILTRRMHVERWGGCVLGSVDRPRRNNAQGAAEEPEAPRASSWLPRAPASQEGPSWVKDGGRRRTGARRVSGCHSTRSA